MHEYIQYIQVSEYICYNVCHPDRIRRVRSSQLRQLTDELSSQALFKDFQNPINITIFMYVMYVCPWDMDFEVVLPD